MVLITREQFTEKLEALVAEKGGDFRYVPPSDANALVGSTGCVYAEAPDVPSCGVGQVIFALKPDILAKLYDAERDGSTDDSGAQPLILEGVVHHQFDDSGDVIDDLDEVIIPPLNEDDKRLAMAASAFQMLQDQGVRYDVCLQAYHEMLGSDLGWVSPDFANRYKELDEGRIGPHAIIH